MYLLSQYQSQNQLLYCLKLEAVLEEEIFEETAKMKNSKLLEWHSSTKSSKETETWNYWIVL